MQLFTALFHLDKKAGLPDKVSKAGAFAGCFFDSEFEARPSFLVAFVTKCLEQAITENLGFTFLVAVE